MIFLLKKQKHRFLHATIFIFHVYYKNTLHKLNVIKVNRKVKMKTNVLKDILTVLAFSGLAYLVSRNYRMKKQRDNERRDYVHFQLF